MTKKVLALVAGLAMAGCSRPDAIDLLEPLALGAPLEVTALVREARGSTQGGDDLFGPTRPTQLNGNVWVLDVRNDHLVRFDSTLGNARIFGREGQGPGDLEFAQDFAVDGDRLIVAETGNGRLSIFDTIGAFRATRPMARPPKHVVARHGRPLVTLVLGEEYAYAAEDDGELSPWARIPEALRRLARSDPATFPAAGPFLAPAHDGGIYVLDPSVLALTAFDGEGRATSVRLLPEPIRTRLLTQRREQTEQWGERAAAFVDLPATKRMTVTADERLLLLLPLPDIWGLLIDPRAGTARPLPLPADRRMHDILWAAHDAGLYGDRLFVTSGSQLYELRMAATAGAIPARSLAEGSASAPHTLTLFTDYECPACALLDRAAGRELRALADGGAVRIEVRHFPLLGHRRAAGAAAAALCAEREGAGWRMHDALFRTVERWTDSAPSDPWFAHLADSLGLDRAAFDACTASPTVAGLLAADLATGRARGLIAVPAVFFDGRLLRPTSPKRLVREVERLASEPVARDAVAQGVP